MNYIGPSVSITGATGPVGHRGQEGPVGICLPCQDVTDDELRQLSRAWRERAGSLGTTKYSNAVYAHLFEELLAYRQWHAANRDKLEGRRVYGGEIGVQGAVGPA